MLPAVLSRGGACFLAPRLRHLSRSPLAAAAGLVASLGTAVASTGGAGGGGWVEMPPHAESGAFPLDLLAEVTCLAHPDKKRGEDAWFVGRYAVGIADGVGGWVEVDVDAGAYARAVMVGCESRASSSVAACEAAGGAVDVDPVAVLEGAHLAVKLPGSTTAVVVTATGGGQLRILNLGDSSALLLRRAAPPRLDGGGAVPLQPEEGARLWTPLLRTHEQLHGTFNMPLQLCAKRHGTSDSVRRDGQLLEVAPALGDVLLLATDGLLDNITVPHATALLARVDWAPVTEYVRLARRAYAEAALEAAGPPALQRLVIRNCADDGGAPSPAALAAAEKAARGALRAASAMLAVAAQRVGRDEKAITPFALAARQAGILQLAVGGKLDDVTVLLALVVPDLRHPRLAVAGK